MDYANLIQTENTFAEFDVLEISHSSKSLFDSCPRKFEFRKMHKCSFRDESLATKGGSALHIACQTALATGDIDQGLFELVWHFDMQWQKSPMEPRSLEAYIGTYLNAMNSEKLSEYELAKIKTTDGELVDATEVSFAIEIENYPFYQDGRTITVRYVGFIDLIMHSRVSNLYATWDIKSTTKEIDHDVQFRFDEQQTPYGLVLEAILGYQCAHNFDVAYWVQRVNVTEPKSLFYTYTRSATDVQDWVKGLFRTLNEIRTFYHAGWFPRRAVSCQAYNRTCMFFDLCGTRNTNTINMILEQSNMQLMQKPREPIVPFITIKVDAGSANG